MQHTAVVPDDDVAGLPAVLPDPRWLAGLRGQPPQQASGFLLILTDDVAGMAPDEEVRASGGGVDAHEGMDYRRQLVQLGLVQELEAPVPGMAEAIAVDSFLVPEPLLRRAVERVPGGAKVCPLGLAAAVRHHVGGEDRRLGADALVGAVRMPLLVAALEARLQGFGVHHLAVLVHVGHAAELGEAHLGGALESHLQPPETARERDMIRVAQVLTRKQQHRMFVPGSLDPTERFVVDRGQIDIAHHRAKSRVEGFDSHGILPGKWRVRHFITALVCLAAVAALHAATVRQTLSNGDTYVGEVVDGVKSGQGEYVWADGHRYVGGYRADQMHGAGTFTWADGREYEGQFVDGRRHGQGVFKLANGDVYDGAFVANAMTGEGTYTFANGDVYQGDFVAGERTGQGVHEWSNGSRYEGGVREGSPHGVGEYTRPDGWTYRGEYAAGARHGHGDLTWPNGNRYVGAFASDQRNGFGYLHWRDGTLYRGHFAAGSPHGAGVKETPEGERFFEYWAQNSLVSSQRIEARAACRLTHAGAEWMFDGDTCVNGLAHGVGDVVRVDGGAWAADAKVVLGRLVEGEVVSLTLLP